MTLNAWNKILIVLCFVLTICCLYLASEIMLKRPETGRYQLGTYGSAAIVLDTTTGKAWIVNAGSKPVKLKMDEIKSPY